MLITTREQFKAALTTLLDADIVAVDTETTFTKSFEERILIGLATHCKIKGREPAEVSFYFPFRHKHNPTLFGDNENLPIEWLKELDSFFSRSDVTLLFHNAKFDMQILRKEGIECPAPFWDTMLMSWMVDENTTHALKGLGALIGIEDAKTEQEIIKKLQKSCGSWEAIPPLAMERYACKDVYLTFRLYEHFLPQIKQQKMYDIWKDESDFSRALQQMEERGIRINPVQARTLAAAAYQRMQEIVQELGFDPGKPASLARKLFGVPPEGLGLSVPECSSRRLEPPLDTVAGVLKYIPNMDKANLSRYDDPIVSLVLEFRGLQKAYSTWFMAFHDLRDSADRLHPTFKQHGTKTTRLSCSGPNMQQLPRMKNEEEEQGVTKTLVKKMLSATDNYQLWEFDYAQVEYRLAAVYSGEASILEAFREGADFHQLTADLLGIDRYGGKTLNFAILYGAGPRKLAEMLSIGESDARELLDNYWAAYPSLSAVVQQATEAAKQRGWVRLWTGRRRHFQYPSEHHKAFNSIIQGGAAEIMKHTMLRFYRNHSDSKFKMVSQVHDALWFEIPEVAVESHSEVIQNVMEWPEDDFGLPFPVDAKVLYK